jgi:hypothetical protein
MSDGWAVHGSDTNRSANQQNRRNSGGAQPSLPVATRIEDDWLFNTLDDTHHGYADAPVVVASSISAQEALRHDNGDEEDDGGYHTPTSTAPEDSLAPVPAEATRLPPEIMADIAQRMDEIGYSHTNTGSGADSGAGTSNVHSPQNVTEDDEEEEEREGGEGRRGSSGSHSIGDAGTSVLDTARAAKESVKKTVKNTVKKATGYIKRSAEDTLLRTKDAMKQAAIREVEVGIMPVSFEGTHTPTHVNLEMVSTKCGEG